MTCWGRWKQMRLTQLGVDEDKEVRNARQSWIKQTSTFRRSKYEKSKQHPLTALQRCGGRKKPGKSEGATKRVYSGAEWSKITV